MPRRLVGAITAETLVILHATVLSPALAAWDVERLWCVVGLAGSGVDTVVAQGLPATSAVGPTIMLETARRRPQSATPVESLATSLANALPPTVGH